MIERLFYHQFVARLLKGTVHPPRDLQIVTSGTGVDSDLIYADGDFASLDPEAKWSLTAGMSAVKGQTGNGQCRIDHRRHHRPLSGGHVVLKRNWK
jgi:hypothetical protein